MCDERDLTGTAEVQHCGGRSATCTEQRSKPKPRARRHDERTNPRVTWPRARPRPDQQTSARMWWAAQSQRREKQRSTPDSQEQTHNLDIGINALHIA